MLPVNFTKTYTPLLAVGVREHRFGCIVIREVLTSEASLNQYICHRVWPSRQPAVHDTWSWSCCRRVGIPPDLGRTETEVLGEAFDAIASLVLPPKAEPTPATNGDIAWRQHRVEEERPGTGKEGGNGGGDEAPDADVFEAPRIPANEIIRTLRAGAVDEHRRASAALSATCIYKEFAEGLGVAGARRAEDGARRKILGSSTDKDDHPAEDRNAIGGARREQQGDVDGEDIDDDDRGWGVSREEFCDYFEAVTDLVDLNGLSLVPQVHQGPVQPTAVGV